VIDRRLLAVAVVAAAAVVAVTIYVVGHPVNPEDVTVERDIQATDWGPLALSFPFFRWLGDFKGIVLEAIIFVAILAFNRRAWIFAIAAGLTSVWYSLLNHLVIRPRPTLAQVFRVDNPGASSFPSGHTIFIVTVVTVLMLALGYRFLRGWTRVLGWLIAALAVFANAISRVYSGAHWPSDVLAGLFIAVAWLAFVLSFHSISQRLLGDSQP
jgi:membrane-associated phospholipid phosphatase